MGFFLLDEISVVKQRESSHPLRNHTPSTRERAGFSGKTIQILRCKPYEVG
jgi:hypothetical protein